MLSLFLLSASLTVPRLYFAVPLIVAVSFVYGATRHERLDQILVHSFKTALWITGFLAVIFGLLWFGGFWN